MLLRLRIKHLALRTQAITLRNQVINLLAPLQHTLNRLVQHDLRLIKLLLDLDNAVCLRRVLVLRDVCLELGEAERGLAFLEGGVCGARVLCYEFVDDFGEDAMRDESGVFVVGYYDPADAFCAAICVECVLWEALVVLRLNVLLKDRTLLLDILSLAWPRSLGNFSSEEC